jgi:hypothetical protein
VVKKGDRQLAATTPGGVGDRKVVRIFRRLQRFDNGTEKRVIVKERIAK